MRSVRVLPESEPGRKEDGCRSHKENHHEKSTDEQDALVH